MAKKRYFQINRVTHLGTEELDDAWKKTDEVSKAEINLIETELPILAEQEFDVKMTGLGHVGLVELLFKLALFKLSREGDHPNRGNLARMDVVVEAMERF